MIVNKDTGETYFTLSEMNAENCKETIESIVHEVVTNSGMKQFIENVSNILNEENGD